MNEPKYHNIQYTETDIRKYLSGQMSAPEMNAFEKAALDDPFLADAIEGIQDADKNFNPTLVTEQLETARKMLQERVNEKKPGIIIPVFWKRAAIAAAVILVAGVWIFNNKQNDGIEHVAQQSEIEAKANPANTNDTADQAPAISAEKQVDPKGKTVVDGGELSSTESESAIIRESELKTKKSVQPSNLVNDWKSDSIETKKDVLAKKDIVVAPAAPLAKPDSETRSEIDNLLSKEAAKKNEVNATDKLEESAGFANKMKDYINVKIVDSNNIPIVGASLTIAEKNKTYLTDKSGLIYLPYTNTLLGATISSVGFQSKTLQLNPDLAVNKIQLSPSPNLSETVVVGYGSKAKNYSQRKLIDTRSPKVMVQNAEPAVGWMEYNKYIDSAKSTVDRKITGDVVISFLVNKAGAISNYKIEQSVSDPLDQAALNIVKSGPGWRLLKGKREKVYVIIRF